MKDERITQLAQSYNGPRKEQCPECHGLALVQRAVEKHPNASEWVICPNPWCHGGRIFSGERNRQTGDHGTMIYAIICDIDGTLANNDHRKHYLENAGKKDWDGFFSEQHLDPVNKEVAWLFNEIQANYAGIIVTGRGEEFREITVKWLRNNRISYVELYMRRAGDRRDDTIVKKEILDRLREDGYVPKLALDDRNRTVEMWRAEGVSCWQVADGNF
jgi:hypothetical protein